jgi:heme ABC exporter ATP-binding subunit CcmA
MSLVDLSQVVVVEGGFPLLSGVTLKVEKGELVVLTGANGAGKTSVLRLLGGLIGRHSGSGTVVGVALTSGSNVALRQKVGWLGHDGSFYDQLTVGENLRFACQALGIEKSGIPAALERVGLVARVDTRADALSAGQRRRMGLAWLILRRPELWLLDEPYAALDVDARALVDDIVGEAVRGGAGVVIAAHDVFKALTVPVREIVIRGGGVAD